MRTLRSSDAETSNPRTLNFLVRGRVGYVRLLNKIPKHYPSCEPFAPRSVNLRTLEPSTCRSALLGQLRSLLTTAKYCP